jgi:hypothetical protein
MVTERESDYLLVYVDPAESDFLTLVLFAFCLQGYHCSL